MATAEPSFIETFSFASWVEKVYPCDKETERKEIDTVIELFTIYFEGNSVFHATRGTLVDLLELLSLLKSQENSEEAVCQLCQKLDNLKLQWNCVSHDQFISVYNGYSLNVSALPITVTFWKYLVDQRILSKSRRMTRAALENEYKVFSGRKSTTKFSHILFCLSWLNLLRVHNNTTIVFNTRTPISFC